MPLLVRRSERDEDFPLGGDGEGVWIDRLPEWQTRRLLPEEVERVTTVLMVLMEKSGFNSVQTAQVFFSGEDAKVAATKVRKRLQRMRDAFTSNGFQFGVIP
jgi:hypothetical protein